MKAGANPIPRCAKWVLEPPHVPADSCVLKFRVNHSESAFATASLVSVEPAVSSRRWPASPHPTRSLAPQPSTFALATREPSSPFGSALSAGRPCFTRKKVTNNRLWLSPSEPLPTQTFLHLKVRSMTLAGILGFSCHQGQAGTTRIRPTHKRPRPYPVWGIAAGFWQEANPDELEIFPPKLAESHEATLAYAAARRRRGITGRACLR
jgi:hypothetical protein